MKNNYKRNKRGQFIYTTGTTRYKKKQYHGKAIDEHRLVWIKANGEIPNGYIIHHINENKKDNRLENLKCMSYTEHNNIHKHAPWNKDIKCPNISKSKMGHPVFQSQIRKCKNTWKEKRRNEGMFILYAHNIDKVSFAQLSKMLGKSYSTIVNKHKLAMGDLYDMHQLQNES